MWVPFILPSTSSFVNLNIKMRRHANGRRADTRSYRQQRHKPVLYLGPQRTYASDPCLANITKRKYIPIWDSIWEYPDIPRSCTRPVTVAIIITRLVWAHSHGYTANVTSKLKAELAEVRPAAEVHKSADCLPAFCCTAWWVRSKAALNSDAVHQLSNDARYSVPKYG